MKYLKSLTFNGNVCEVSIHCTYAYSHYYDAFYMHYVCLQVPKSVLEIDMRPKKCVKNDTRIQL